MSYSKDTLDHITGRRVLTKHTYRPKKGENFEGVESMTEPNQAIPLKTLLYNYTRGIKPNMREPIYHEDEYIPDLKQMDLSELAEYMSSVKERIDELQKIQKDEKAKEQEEALRAKYMAEFQQELDKEKAEEPETRTTLT